MKSKSSKFLPLALRLTFYSLVRRLSSYVDLLTFSPAPFDYSPPCLYLVLPLASVSSLSVDDFYPFEVFVVDDLLYVPVPSNCTPNSIVKNFYHSELL